MFKVLYNAIKGGENLKENTSLRLKQIMTEQHLRQVDILERAKPYLDKYNVKLGRNDISQYVSGKVEPRQDKLTVLGLALNVNEAWLMGYDVPRERKNFSSDDAKIDFALVDKFSMLSLNDKNIVMNLIDSLLEKAGFN